MGFMDKLKELTQPYDDENDFFEGADPSFRPQPKSKPEQTAKQAAKSAPSTAQMFFENSFADETPVPAEDPTKKPAAPEGGGGIFGNLGFIKSGRTRTTPRERTVNFGGKDTSVLLFSPKSFDEAGELVGYMNQNLTVVMTLEGVQGDMARRLLDFLSGIAFALGGKITPVSAKTYFITPQNVDILGTQNDQPESDSHYF